MGTRGLYGMRKNEIDKTSYNHFDSYPTGLGRDILNFIKNHSIEEMNSFYDRIIMVNEQAKPTEQEIKNCMDNNSVDLSVSNKSTDDWYCLLRELQGDLDALYKCNVAYMTNGSNFIKDSLFCEYAYIINLDTKCLEFYKGFQHNPQKGNRYGEKPNEDSYYPCALVAEIPIVFIQATDVNEIINKFMNEEEN